MASKVDICNHALQNIGSRGFITSLSEDTPTARECNLRYDTARRALLSLGVWNFAKARLNLSPDPDNAPPFNYTYAYELPADFIKVIMTKREEQYQGRLPSALFSNQYVHDGIAETTIDKYVIETINNKLYLLSNEDDVGIIYVKNVTNTGQFLDPFTSLFSRLLGALISYKVTGNRALRGEEMQLFKVELEEALTIDGQQGVVDVLDSSGWLAEVQ